jgi:hypothetical protein
VWLWVSWDWSVGIGGYFQNSGAELLLISSPKRSLFFRVGDHVFTGCRAFFENRARRCAVEDVEEGLIDD